VRNPRLYRTCVSAVCSNKLHLPVWKTPRLLSLGCELWPKYFKGDFVWASQQLNAADAD